MYCKDCKAEIEGLLHGSRLCAACRKIRRHAYYLANKDRELSRHCVWKAAHKDKFKEYSRKHRQKDPEKKRKADRVSKLRRIYNITESAYDNLYKEQAGKCAICKTWYDRLHIDHCHVSNKVRELLCGSCNRALGLLKDNPDLFIQAANYLSKWQITQEF